jgi:epoxyqueuosine reductase
MSRSIQELQELTQNLPVNLIGISTADWSPLEEQLDASFGQWLSEGRQGSMEYLKRQLESKYHPQKMLSGAKSLVVCGLNYYQQAPWQDGLLINLSRGTDQKNPKATGRIARYAWGRDYHKGFKKELQRLANAMVEGEGGQTYKTRAVVDSSPLHERLAADAAGFAFTAKNTLVINHNLGSWFFIGVILTTEELEPTGDLVLPGDRPPPSPGEMSLRMSALLEGLPHWSLGCGLQDGRPALHQLSHHRTQGKHRPRAAALDGGLGLRL